MITFRLFDRREVGSTRTVVIQQIEVFVASTRKRLAHFAVIAYLIADIAAVGFAFVEFYKRQIFYYHCFS